MGPERVVWASPSPQLPSGAGVAGRGGRRAVSRRGAARAAGRARRASGPSVDARRALSLPAVPRRWRTESGLSPTPEGGRVQAAPLHPAEATSRGRWSEGGRWAAAAAVARTAALPRAAPRSGPGRALPGCPKGRADAGAFRFPSCARSQRLAGSAHTDQHPGRSSPPGTLAPQSHRPVLQASLDGDQEEGRASPSQAVCWEGGVPFADPGLLGGLLRRVRKRKCNPTGESGLLGSLPSLLQVKKPHPPEGSAPHPGGALLLPCP